MQGSRRERPALTAVDDDVPLTPDGVGQAQRSGLAPIRRSAAFDVVLDVATGPVVVALPVEGLTNRPRGPWASAPGGA